MTSKKIALVTGANKGLGLEISRQLALEGHFVIMTSRRSDGEDAALKILERGLDVIHLILDVNRHDEIQHVLNVIESRFGRLDILINNAGVLLDRSTTLLDSSENDLRITLETNLIAPITLCQTFVPLMIKNNYGRIVNISSSMGSIHEMSESSLAGSDWSASAYRISKTALNAVTILLAQELRGKNILVNSACPGWVRTDMGGENAPLSVEQGAKTPVWLATLPDGGPTGKFFRNKKEIPW